MAEDEVIIVGVVDEEEEETSFKIHKNKTPLRKVFKTYAERENIPLACYQFSFGDKSLPLNSSATAAELGIDDNNTIHAFFCQKQRVAKNIGGVTVFGTVIDCHETGRTQWNVQYDNGLKESYGNKGLMQALGRHKREENKDTGMHVVANKWIRQIVRIVDSSDGSTISEENIGMNLRGHNADFDDFLFNNVESVSLELVVGFWACRYKQLEGNFGPHHSIRMVFCHSVNSVLSKIDDRRTSSGEIISFVKAHIWTSLMMQDESHFNIIIGGYLTYREKLDATNRLASNTIGDLGKCHENNAISDIFDAFPRMKGAFDPVKIGGAFDANSAVELMMEYFTEMMRQLEDVYPVTPSNIEEINLDFIDTRNLGRTSAPRINISQPLREIFQMYAKQNHIPIEKLQFMLGCKKIQRDTHETPAMFGMGEKEVIAVFRICDLRSTNQLKFHATPEYFTFVYKGGNDEDSDKRMISVIDTITYKKVNFKFGKTTKIKTILNAYSTHVGVSPRDLSFTHNGNMIFLSSVGKKTMFQLGKAGPIIVSLRIDPSSEENEKNLESQTNKNKETKKKFNKRSNRKKCELPLVDEEEKLRQHHSKAISSVFEEADPTFRKIRQRLNAMNLERTVPKEKKTRPKPELMNEPVENPPTDGLAGKAGKNFFIIQVGEATNLYKTAKSSATVHKPSCSSRKYNIMIDLHGLTKDCALHQLDECLPSWIDIAMKGSQDCLWRR